jgi:hypothetical protein
VRPRIDEWEVVEEVEQVVGLLVLVDFDERGFELGAHSALQVRLRRVEENPHIRLVLVEDREGLETVVVDILGLENLKGFGVEKSVFAKPIDI